MKRKATLRAITILVLLISIIGVVSIEVTYAPSSPLPYELPEITILSPLPNGTYSQSEIPLNITVQIFGYTYQSMEWLNSLNCSLDGTDTPITLSFPPDYSVGYYVNASGSLADLSDGNHTLAVYVKTDIGNENRYSNATSLFIINTQPSQMPSSAPSISASSSPIQQPTQSPSPTANNNQAENFTSTIIATCLVVLAIVVGLLVYFKKRRR